MISNYRGFENLKPLAFISTWPKFPARPVSQIAFFGPAENQCTVRVLQNVLHMFKNTVFP